MTFLLLRKLKINTKYVLNLFKQVAVLHQSIVLGLSVEINGWNEYVINSLQLSLFFNYVYLHPATAAPTHTFYINCTQHWATVLPAWPTSFKEQCKLSLLHFFDGCVFVVKYNNKTIKSNLFWKTRHWKIISYITKSIRCVKQFLYFFIDQGHKFKHPFFQFLFISNKINYLDS